MSYYDENTMKFIEKNKLGMEDTFEFGCNACGKCCRNRETLILAGYDVFRIAKFKGMTTQEVLNKYCFGYIGSDSRLPIVSIKPRQDNACPFLRMGKCELHNPSAKVLTCSLFPLGRAFDSRTNEYIYFKQPDVTCGNGEKHTLKEWLDTWGIQELDAIFKFWGSALVDLATFCRSIKNKERLQAVQETILAALYVNYDTSRPYIEELQNNLQLLSVIYPELKKKH